MMVVDDEYEDVSVPQPRSQDPTSGNCPGPLHMHMYMNTSQYEDKQMLPHLTQQGQVMV